jgi:serine/threonine protein kinase
VAVKRTTKAGDYVSREYEVLDKLKDCRNVIKLLDIYYSKNEEGKTAQNLIFEYCRTNLEEVIQNSKKAQQYIPVADVRNYMKQIFEGMSYVHH